MTLSAARTLTEATGLASGEDQLLRRDGDTLQPLSGAAKGLRHLAYLRHTLGFKAALKVITSNTFPTGCGIASSASGLGALTLAALAAWTETDSLAALAEAGFPPARLAALARLGSGSACRSFFGGYVAWEAGETPEAQTVRPVLAAADWPLADLIVLVSPESKAVGSSEGHLSAGTSPLYPPRLAGLPARLRRVYAALAARDLPALGLELEAEALEMHAVMLSATPSLRYLLPGSVEVLTWLRLERERSGLQAYFTIDAGPNIHILCAQAEALAVRARLRAAFPALQVLMDGTGDGPLLSRRALP
jgi:diphosphomevalonate decarboxylase